MIALKYTTNATTVTHKLKHRAFTVTRLIPQPPFTLAEIKPGHTVAQVVQDTEGGYNLVIGCNRAGCSDWFVAPLLAEQLALWMEAGAVEGVGE